MNISKNYLFILMIACVFYISKTKAQTILTPANTYIVTAKTGTSEAKLASEAVEKTDFNNYRLRSVHRKLSFENGVVIELLSAEELVNLGYKIDPLNFTEKMDAKYVDPTYSISPSGILMQLFQKVPTKSQTH